MADISLEAVAGKLNRVSYEAFFKALRQAKNAGNRNVELVHWLFHILQNEHSDIALTTDYFKIDRGKLMTDITSVVDSFRKNETEMPAVSNTVMDLFDRGWHYATLFFGETQIRTGHVLVGALQSRELARAFNNLSREFAKILVDTLTNEHRKIWAGWMRTTCARWTARAWSSRDARSPGCRRGKGYDRTRSFFSGSDR